GDGFEMRGITDGAYLYYQNVHHMSENAKLLVRGNCEHNPCTIEVREGGADGDLLGSYTCEPECASQHGDTREFPIHLTNTQGTHSLCFVFRGAGEDLFVFEDFHFIHY
ncbi:MAG: carbohydrate-binding protein, partial [Clostridia bacterium]|nr:carbohydrate-binding protein [Clostridia bacterium]